MTQNINMIKTLLAALLVCCLLPLNTFAASDFKLIDIGGVEHRLSNYKGKWVLLNYWAT